MYTFRYVVKKNKSYQLFQNVHDYYCSYDCKHSELDIHHQSFDTKQWFQKSDKIWQIEEVLIWPFCQVRNGVNWGQILKILAFLESLLMEFEYEMAAIIIVIKILQLWWNSLTLD